MNDFRGRPRWVYTWGGRLTICGGCALIAVGLMRVFEVWVWPEAATSLALAQMESDVAAAESLRQATALHGALPWVTAAVVTVTALVLFLPGHARRICRILQWF